MDKKIETLGRLFARSYHVDLDMVDRGRGTTRRLVTSDTPRPWSSYP